MGSTRHLLRAATLPCNVAVQRRNGQQTIDDEPGDDDLVVIALFR